MKCKICGGEIKPGELECQYCGNADFIPELFSEDEFERKKNYDRLQDSKPSYTDLTGDETVIVKNTPPVRERFCRKCGRELNTNGKCRVCDNDNSEHVRPSISNDNETLSGRKNKKQEKEKMNPMVKIVFIIFTLLVLFAVSYMMFFNWMSGLSSQEQINPTETPIAATEMIVDDSSDKARWETTSTNTPVVSIPQPAPTPSGQKNANSPTTTQSAKKDTATPAPSQSAKKDTTTPAPTQSAKKDTTTPAPTQSAKNEIKSPVQTTNPNQPEAPTVSTAETEKPREKQ